MASKTTYELDLKLGAKTSPSWKTTLGKVTSGLQSVNALSTKILSGMAGSVTAAGATATYALSNAMDTYVSFEQEMATVQSISGASATQFFAMKEAALEAGSSTVFTATEAASALEYMSLAGWDVNTSISNLNPMLKMAAATGKELQTTSDLVTDSMSALGLEVDDLDMYLDKLVKTNNSANTTAEELMEALVKTGGASRTLGADLDDTITALGVLADNGLKGEAAGTALNAIFTRLFGNTTAIKELNKLGVDLWTDAGKFIGFEEGLDRINAALSELNDKQRAFSMKNISGTHYSSQMKYLLESRKPKEGSDTDTNAWDTLEEKVVHSTGALKNMYDITTDTLLNAQKRLESAKEDMQIRLVDVFSDDAKDFVSWLAESLPNVTESIVDFAETHQGEFARTLDGLEEGIEFLWENGIAAGKWIIKHKGAIIGALSSMTGSMVLLKTATMGLNIAKFFTNPLSAGVTVAGAVIAAIGGIKGAFRDAEDAAINADLASRFGEIELSMRDVERVAAHLVQSESLIAVLASLEEFDELKSISGIMEDASKELEKTHWKISVGMELTKDEQETYKKAIDDYIASAQDYARQAQYAVSVSLDYNFAEDVNTDSIDTKVLNFFSEKEEALAACGKRLNDAMTEAFNDGLLDIEKVPTIAKIQAEMAEIQESIEIGKTEARFAYLEQQYAGMELTPDSLVMLSEEIDKQSIEAAEAYQEWYENSYAAFSTAHEGGGLTDDEYNERVEQLNKDLANKKAESLLRGKEFLLSTISKAYEDEIGQYNKAVADSIAYYSDDVYSERWESAPVVMWDSMLQDIIKEGPDKTSKAAVRSLVETMSGSMDVVYGLIDNWDSLTPEMQLSAQNVLGQYETLQGMSVDKISRKGNGLEGLYRNVANEVYNSEDSTNIGGYVNRVYEDLTGYVKTASITSIESSLESSKAKSIRPAIDELHTYSQEYLDQVFSQELSALAEVNISMNPSFNVTGIDSFAQGMLGIAGVAQYNVPVLHNAKGGIYNSPILTTFAEEGPEAAVPLDGSLRAKQLWMQAGQILGTLPNGTRDQELLNGISAMNREDSGKSMQIIYNPNIVIQGATSKEEVQSALALSIDELREMLEEIQREDARVSFR